jgi:hypothetical protein
VCPSSSQGVSQDVPNSTTLLSHMLCLKVVIYSPIDVGQRASIASFGEAPKVWFLYASTNQNGPLEKRKVELGRHPSSN